MCCAVLFVSACGGGTSATVGATGSPTTATSGGVGSDAAGGARGFPGVTGLLAEIDGTTLQVQGTDTQTAVTYSGSTTFTNTVVARLSDVVLGTCVQVRSAQPDFGMGGATPAPAPRATDGPIAATAVEISPAVNGNCSALGGTRTSGERPTGAGGDATRAPGAPTFGQTRGPGAGSNEFGGLGASGKVIAVAGFSFTVESSRPQSSTATTAVPTTRTVQTSAATTYTRTRAANTGALAVGLCVTALGKASDTGSIAATSIALRPAVNGSCSAGFGGRGPSGSPTSTEGGSGV